MLVEAVEKYRRHEKDHPNILNIEIWKQTRRQSPLLDLAKYETQIQFSTNKRELEIFCPVLLW